MGNIAENHQTNFERAMIYFNKVLDNYGYSLEVEVKENEEGFDIYLTDSITSEKIKGKVMRGEREIQVPDLYSKNLQYVFTLPNNDSIRIGSKAKIPIDSNLTITNKNNSFIEEFSISEQLIDGEYQLAALSAKSYVPSTDINVQDKSAVIGPISSLGYSIDLNDITANNIVRNKNVLYNGEANAAYYFYLGESRNKRIKVENTGALKFGTPMYSIIEEGTNLGSVTFDRALNDAKKYLLSDATKEITVQTLKLGNDINPTFIEDTVNFIDAVIEKHREFTDSPPIKTLKTATSSFQRQFKK